MNKRVAWNLAHRDFYFMSSQIQRGAKRLKLTQHYKSTILQLRKFSGEPQLSFEQWNGILKVLGSDHTAAAAAKSLQSCLTL